MSGSAIMDEIYSTSSDCKHWFLVRCKSKQKQRASLNFRNQMITSYFPTIDVFKTIRGKTTPKKEALFPDYLFVHLDISSNYALKVNNTFIEHMKKITLSIELVANKTEIR